jgi:hypothetical protein
MEIYFLNYVRLYIAYLFLIFNVVQEHNLRRQNLNKSGDIRLTVTLWCGPKAAVLENSVTVVVNCYDAVSPNP